MPGRLSRNALRIALVAIVLTTGLLVWRSTRTAPVSVAVAQVDRGRVELAVANTRAGTVNACRRARLAPPIGGQIAALPVREGERVKEGQVLLALWSEDAAAQVRVAEEQSRSAGLRSRETCVRFEIAQRDAERARQLHREQLLPDEQLDRAVAAADTLRAACAASRAETGQSAARVEAARASLTRTVLRAPFAGVIAKVTGERGEFTTPSPPGIPTPPVIDLIDDSCLYVTAPIDEVDVARVRAGQPAYVTIEALGDRRIPGRVKKIGSYVLDREKQARTVDVDVELLEGDPAKTLLAGYSADVEIVLDARENALRVPTQALLEGSRVLVLSGTGRRRIEERTVKTGISNWKYTEVVSGLIEGETVVLSVERKGVVAGAEAVAESDSR